MMLMLMLVLVLLAAIFICPRTRTCSRPLAALRAITVATARSTTITALASGVSTLTTAPGIASSSGAAAGTA